MWENSLIQLGYKFSVNTFESAGCVLVVCLPRLDFSSSLLSLGALGAIYDNAANSINIDNLIGKNVTYYDKSKRKIGRLESIEDISGVMYANIVHHKNTKGNSRSLSELIGQSKWDQIALAKNQSGEEDEGKNSSSQELNPLKLTERSSGDFYYEKLEKMFGNGFCAWLMKQSNQNLFLLPESQRRIDEELSYNEVYLNSIGNVNLGKVLKNRLKLVKYGDRNTSISHIDLIESSPTISDYLENNKESSKIVILGRNQPSYDDNASFVNSYLDSYEPGELNFEIKLSRAIFHSFYKRK